MSVNSTQGTRSVLDAAEHLSSSQCKSTSKWDGPTKGETQVQEMSSPVHSWDLVRRMIHRGIFERSDCECVFG